MGLLETSKCPHVLEELSSINIVHDEVNSTRSLKYVVHTDDEWMIQLKHDETLQIDILDRIFVYYYIFSHTFHSVVFSVLW